MNSRKYSLAFLSAVLAVSFSFQTLAAGKARPKGPTRAEIAAAETLKIAPKLTRPGDPIWFPEMLSWMAARAKEPFVDGNRMELLHDGPEYYPRRLEMIRRARRSIDIATFLWCDDESGLRIANELVRARQRGVRVRVLISYFNVKPSTIVEGRLRSAGIQIITVNPPYWGLDQIQAVNHEKIMVVDGRESLVGGANLCNEYMIGGGKEGLWREMEIYTFGPLNTRVQERYDDTWNILASTDSDVRCGYDSFGRDTRPGSGFRCRPPRFSRYSQPTPSDAAPRGESAALFHYVQPYLSRGYITKYEDTKTDPQDSRALYSELIKRARNQLVLYIPYLSPPKSVMKAITGAARRGVRVIVFTNSYHVNDLAKPLAGAATGFYKPLLEAGVEIHEFWHRTLHAKAFLIDDTTLAVGSHNLTARSFKSRGETSIITGDQALITKFQRGIEQDLARETKQITLQNLEQIRPEVNNGFLQFIGKLLRDFI